jgi:hypothetical protein
LRLAGRRHIWNLATILPRWSRVFGSLDDRVVVSAEQSVGSPCVVLTSSHQGGQGTHISVFARLAPHRATMPSAPSENSPVSSNGSSSSRESMLTPPQSPQLAKHPFLPPARASTISSWRSTIPERISRSHTAPGVDSMSRDAAIEAYQQLKLALFSKVRSPQPSDPTRSASSTGSTLDR